MELFEVELGLPLEEGAEARLSECRSVAEWQQMGWQEGPL